MSLIQLNFQVIDPAGIEYPEEHIEEVKRDLLLYIQGLFW